jgi:phosphate-selective porin OprO and OprP
MIAKNEVVTRSGSGLLTASAPHKFHLFSCRGLASALLVGILSAVPAWRTAAADAAPATAAPPAAEGLTQRLQELEQKVQSLEAQRQADQEAANKAAAAQKDQDTATRAALEQQVKKLEAQQKADQEAASKAAKGVPRVTVGASGLSVASADTNFMIALHGLLQVDNRSFFDDGGIVGNDGFILRKVRPILQGTLFRDFDFLFAPDFGGSSPVIQDAYLNYRYRPWLQVRGGKFKTPVGLEQLQPDPATLFNERALPTGLTPNRDIGFQLWGEVEGGKLAYAAGVFNGVGDGRNNTTGSDFEDHREVAGRLWLQPFKGSKSKALQGFGFGVGGSYGFLSPTNTLGLTAGYLTDGQQTFFVYSSGVTALGNHWRVSPQGYYYFGPFGFMGEYVISDQQVSSNAISANLQHTGWEVSASWMLTGEDSAYTGVTPKHPFDPRNGKWGAFQLVARYAELDIDNDTFPRFANPAASASAAQAWSAGLNWYLNKNVRVAASFSRTTFTGGGTSTATTAPAIVTRQPEQVFFTRLQLAF